MSAYLPPCCHTLAQDWPWAIALPEVILSRCHFSAEHWQPEQFERSAILPARGLAKRQSEYLAGRICAREGLQRLGAVQTQVLVAEDGAPIWPDGYLGSISHSHGQAAALVAKTAHWQGLGLDLEKPLSAERAQRLAGEILTPAELASIAQLPLEQQAWLISVSFSLKESLFKALYPIVQKRFYFHDAALLFHPQQPRAQLRLLTDLSPQWPANSFVDGHFCLHDGLIYSLVAIAHSAA